MNDIEVLEKIKLGIKIDTQAPNVSLRNMATRKVQAIENLLKERQSDKERIKDLEEINEAHKKENGELREELESVKEIYYTQKEMEDVMVRYRKLVENSIPKSLIKEKIEELIKEGRHYNANKIEVLQELLEKR